MKMTDVMTILLFLFLAWLLFANIQDHALWNDEAFTGVMARNVLRFGYPRSFDNLNYGYPLHPEFNWPGTYICIAETWPPVYLVSLSFKLFGIDTWTARLPFVVIGFLTLILLYIFCIRRLASKTIGVFSILLLGTSVPFLLHARQVRYYTLVIFLCLAMFYVYHSIIEKKKRYTCFAFLATILSLTNHVAFVPMFTGIWFVALFMDREKMEWRRFIAVSTVPLFFFIAWAVFSSRGTSDAGCFPVNLSFWGIKKNLEFQIRTINGYFIPIAFWIVTVILLRIFKKQDIVKPDKNEMKIFKRIVLILACNIIFFSIFGLRTMRYYVQYLPFLFLVEAFLLYRIFQWKRILGVAIVLVVIFTNFLARPNPLFLTRGLPAPFDVSRFSKFRTYFLDYLYELTHEYTGPLEAVCDYLDLHARPGERIKIIKGDLTVMFYHPELVVLNDARYFKKSYPEWIVIRSFWNPVLEEEWGKRPEVGMEDGYLDVLDSYDKIGLPAVDTIRENVPDYLEEHYFRMLEITPENQMYVYRLREG